MTHLTRKDRFLNVAESDQQHSVARIATSMAIKNTLAESEQQTSGGLFDILSASEIPLRTFVGFHPWRCCRPLSATKEQIA